MVPSYDYYYGEGNDHADFDGRHSHPQHEHVATPHDAMTEILAATGSTSPPSPRHIKRPQASTKQNRPSSKPETKAKKALRLKAAKHFHRGGISSSSAAGVDGSSSSSGNNTRSNNNTLSKTAQSKEVKSPSTVDVSRSSNKYFYPEESSSSSSVPAGDGQELSAVDGINKIPSPNMISPSSNNSSDTNYIINHKLDKIIEDDPEIEAYDSASEIGSGYNSGSDLENAARKILRRRGVGGSLNSSSRPNYNSDDNASDTGSAISSSASSSFRKLPDGWKERIKRKGGMSKLPPTMDKKEKPPLPKSKVSLQSQKEQPTQQQEELPPKEDVKQTEVQPTEETDNVDDEYEGQLDSSGINQYHDHFSAIASACEDSDDDEYYQDHFNGNANGSFPSFSNHNKHEVDNNHLSSILDYPPIYEEHVFGPTKPSTIYESNDEYEQDENDDSLFNEEWNADDLSLLKNNGSGVNVDREIVRVQEVDESGFPSPSRKTKALESVDISGFPSSSPTNIDQKGTQHMEQTAADGRRSIDFMKNDFNKDDYFHQFDQKWEQNFSPPPGVKWKKSTKRGAAALPQLTNDDNLAPFAKDKDADVSSFAWSNSSFRDNVEAPVSAERSDKMREGNGKERQDVSQLPVRQTKKEREKVVPAMQPFSDGDLSDLGNNISDAEAAVGTTTPSKRRLNFFKRRGRRYYSEGERSDSDWDTDASKNSPRIKSPLRRRNKVKKQITKTNETRRRLFGASPKKAEKSCPPAPAPVKETSSAASPPPVSEKTLKPDNPRGTVTPIVSNTVMKTPDSKPVQSVDMSQSDATCDKTVSTLGSIITKETSSKATGRVASSNASANTAMSEIERLRKENDKLRQELERQAARRENERLRQELEKGAASEAPSSHLSTNTNGASEYGNEISRTKKNHRNQMHKSTLSSFLENDVNAKQRPRRHRVTKNHLMKQADFDDESLTSRSPPRPNRRVDDRTGPELLSKVAGATDWVASQVRNAAQGQGHRPLDCFTACSRADRGRRRAKGAYANSGSDTDSLEDDSLLRVGGRPRPPIARRRRPEVTKEQLL